MKRARVILMIGVVIACGSAAVAETVGTHKVYLPADIKWGPAAALVAGGSRGGGAVRRPSKRGRVRAWNRAPKDYRIPPHMHSKPELLTVVSGKFGLGMGPAADRANVKSLPAGSFSSMPAGVVHYVFVDEESVIQINAVGPWDIEYVDPRSDPRLNVAPSK